MEMVVVPILGTANEDDAVAASVRANADLALGKFVDSDVHSENSFTVPIGTACASGLTGHSFHS
jgi:hypothetical protein